MTPDTKPSHVPPAPCGAGTPACASPKATAVGVAHRQWPLASLPIQASLRAARRQECLRHIGWRIVAALLEAFALPASAQEPPPPMTLSEVIELARGASPRVAQLRSLELAAREGERYALAGRMPQLELSAGYTRNSDVPEFSVALPGFQQTIFPNIPDAYRTRAAAQLPLYTGGRVGASIDAARSNLAAAAEDIVAGDRDAVLEAAAAYWNLATALESERVLTASLAAFDQHLADAGNRVDLGFAARNELLAVQSERDRAELQRLRARNAAEVGNANLLRLLNLPLGTNIVPSASFDAVAETPDGIEPLVAESLAARAELKALRSRVEASDAAASTARAARRPQASLAAAWDYASPNSRVLPLTDAWEDTWSVGVAVSWMVFDGGRSSASEAKARAEAEALRRYLEDVELRVRLEVTQRSLELETAIAGVAVARRGLEAAEENERVSRDRYREGVSASSDLLDAETQTLRAGLDLVAAHSALRIAEAQLARALGR